MIQSTITRYFEKNIYNNVKKEVNMDFEEESSEDVGMEMDVEVKGELVLDWDEVDNCHGQISDNVDRKYTPKVVLEKLPKLVLQKYNITKNPAPEKKPSESLSECPKCKRTYRNLTTFRNHIDLCGKERDMKCDHCSYKTRYKSVLSSHISNIHKNGKDIEKRLKKICEKCNETASKLSLTKCGKCFGKLILHCAKCNKQFKTTSLAFYHWYTRCGVKGYFNCAKCDFKSVWRAKVVAHMKRSHPSQDLSEELKNIEWLDLKHDKEKSEANKYKCPKCAKPMGNSHKLSIHTYGCGGSEYIGNSNAEVKNGNRSVESEAIKCSKCDKVFSHIYSLNRHIQHCMGRQQMAKASDIDSEVDIDVVDENKDLPVKPLVSADERYQRYVKMTVRHCGKCQEDRSTEFNSWGMGRKVPCQKCNQTLLFKCRKCLITKSKYRNLKDHFDNICDPQEEFKCTKCNYKTFTFKRLKGHYDTVHETANVDCDKCGRKFRKKHTLRDHLRQCGVEPQIQCAHCPFKCLRKENLKSHLSHKHMGRIDIIDRGEVLKISLQRFSRAKLHLNAFCSKCKKKQLLSKRLKICQICKTKLYYKCKTCKNKYDVDDENACIHVKAHLETIKFECKHCGKGAASKRNSLAHERACGSNTMYKCRFCKYAAKLKYNTVKHEQVQHPHEL